MTGNLDHVDESVRSYVSAPVQERIAFIQTDRFIHHPLTAAIRLRLDDLLAHPRSLRMPSLLIYGQPGSGKTSLLADYLQDHPQEHAPNNAVVMRVLYTEMSPGPDQFKLYSGLMHQIGAPLGRRSLAAQEQRTLVFLERAGVRMIIVDEVQHILSGKPTQQRVVLNTLKFLSNRLMATIVAAGTEDALAALSTDPAVASRFQCVALERWRMGEGYLRFLRTIERLMPLRHPSGLAQESAASAILSLTRGVTGEIVRLLNAAAIMAVRDGNERITLETLARTDLFLPGMAPGRKNA